MVPDAHNRKEKELYEDHKNFLHIVLKCTIKKGGVVESMGSVTDSNKRRGLPFEENRERIYSKVKP